jgi:hypothetical protein
VVVYIDLIRKLGINLFYFFVGLLASVFIIVAMGVVTAGIFEMIEFLWSLISFTIPLSGQNAVLFLIIVFFVLFFTYCFIEIDKDVVKSIKKLKN